MCDIARFEKTLRRLKRKRNTLFDDGRRDTLFDDGSSASAIASIPSDGQSASTHLDTQAGNDKPVKKDDPNKEWVPAPAPLLDAKMMLSLEAKATDPLVDIDKRKGEDGSQNLKFTVGPYELQERSSSSKLNKSKSGSGSGSATLTAPLNVETPLVKQIPISNRTQTMMRFTATAEPSDWFQVVSVSDTPGDVESAPKFSTKVSSTSKLKWNRPQALKTTKFSRSVASKYTGARETILAPGEATSIGVRFKPYPPSDTKHWPMQSATVKKGSLVLTFDGTRVQKFDLQSTMLRPSVEINHALGKPSLLAQFSTLKFAHDFSNVYVRFKSNAVVEMRNPTEVAAKWRIVHVPRQKSNPVLPVKVKTLKKLNMREFDLDSEAVDDPSVFTFSRTTGTIQAKTRAEAKGFVTNTTASLDNLIRTLHKGLGVQDTRPIKMVQDGVEHLQLGVTFCPKDQKEYFCKFRIEIEHGHPRHIEVHLRGTGTLAEHKK